MKRFSLWLTRLINRRTQRYLDSHRGSGAVTTRKSPRVFGVITTMEGKRTPKRTPTIDTVMAPSPRLKLVVTDEEAIRIYNNIVEGME